LREPESNFRKVLPELLSAMETFGTNIFVGMEITLKEIKTSSL